MTLSACELNEVKDNILGRTVYLKEVSYRVKKLRRKGCFVHFQRVEVHVAGRVVNNLLADTV